MYYVYEVFILVALIVVSICTAVAAWWWLWDPVTAKVRLVMMVVKEN